MRADDVVVDALVVAQLDLETATERREHLGEDDLLVPHRLVAAALHRRPALTAITQYNNNTITQYNNNSSPTSGPERNNTVQ